ncbi:MAG: patatin family protein [Holdemanella sp.]|nr:patatin family protein [Holdemanella sp.]
MVNVGLVAEGGGTKAAYTAGVLKCFLENGINIHYVVGISAASEILCAFTSKQIDRIEVTGIDAPSQKGVVGVTPFLKEGNFFALEGTVDYIERRVPLDLDKLYNSDIEMDTGVYNMESHEVEYYDKTYIKKDHALIMASCALLILCKPRKFLGKMYTDAGLRDMISINQSIKHGCNKHIVISTKEEGYVRKPAPAYQLWLSNLLYHDKIITEDLRRRHERYNEQWGLVNKLRDEGKALVIRPSKDIGVTRYTTDPEKLKPWFQLGYDETYARLDEIRKFMEE